jgi:hypothetical protein
MTDIRGSLEKDGPNATWSHVGYFAQERLMFVLEESEANFEGELGTLVHPRAARQCLGTLVHPRAARQCLGTSLAFVQMDTRISLDDA